jgi:hypothetical protein
MYHGGELPDYQAKVKLLAESGLGVALMYNTSSSTLASLLNVGYRDRIESGIINILFGMDPADQPGQSLLSLNSYPVSLSYTLLQVFAGIVILLNVLSAFRLRTIRNRLGKSRFAAWRIIVTSVLIHFILPIALLLVIPAIAGASWPFILVYIPDAGWFALGVSVTLMIIGYCKARVFLGYFFPQLRINHPTVSS